MRSHWTQKGMFSRQTGRVLGMGVDEVTERKMDTAA